MIPKIIHQTYASAKFPAQLAANIERIRATNPGWSYRFYDDAAVERFIRQHYPPAVLAAWHRIDPGYGAARADLFRYLLIYARGGVYLDLKSTVVRPLDEVLRADDTCVLAHWPNRSGDRFDGWGQHPGIRNPRGEFQQWHVIAAPRHPYLRAVIRSVLRNIMCYEPALHGVGKPAVLRTTGPVAYTMAIEACREAAPHRVADTHEDLGLVYSITESHGQLSHARLLFKSHYSRHSHPLVRPFT